MSELLLRGWNVAVPVVDVGDDVFIIDDADLKTLRLQVKSAQATGGGAGFKFTFKLSRSQLARVERIELCSMLMLRFPDRWRFLVVPRDALNRARKEEEQHRRPGKRGRPMVSDEAAKGDALSLIIELRGDDASGWGTQLSQYLDRWPPQIPVVAGGPGSTRATEQGAGRPREAVPAPSRGPET